MSALPRISPFVIAGLAGLAGLSGLAAVSACAPARPQETVASPVAAASRSTETLRGEFGGSFDRQVDDGTIVRRLVAPTAMVWEALVAALTARAPKLTLIDRAVGRVGDTSLVLVRRWNGLPVSRYFRCGSTLTGARADEERVRAIYLAQLTKLGGDTVAVSMHLSGYSEPMNSGNSGQPTQCTTTGQAERELIQDVARRIEARR